MKKGENKMPEEQLEDKIKQYRNGAKKAVVGLGFGVLGLTFDYGIVDDAMRICGGFIAGYNLRNTINYIRYSLKGE